LERLVRQRAGAVVLITHDPAEAFAIADRVAVIQEGRIVQVGTPTDVVMDPATPFVAAFTGAELLLDARVTGYADELLTVQLPGGVQLHAVAAPGHGFRPGAPVHVAYRPEDIVLSTGEAETSARNRLSLRVASLVPAGSLIRVRLEGGVELAALVTRESAERLGLAPGRPVIAHLKATALRAYPAPERWLPAWPAADGAGQRPPRMERRRVPPVVCGMSMLRCGTSVRTVRLLITPRTPGVSHASSHA